MKRTHMVPDLSAHQDEAIHGALGLIPTGVCVLTSAWERWRRGRTVYQVQMACDAPPTVSVSIPTGTPIMPLISDSHRFGLNILPEGDPHGYKHRFVKGGTPNEKAEDMFMSVPHHDVAGVPILKDCLAWFVCELIMHVDLEGDADLFIGRAIEGGVVGTEAPKVTWRVK